MTCIVGKIEGGHAYIGADSFTGEGNFGLPQVNSKIFQHGALLVGSCGDGRVTQIIQHHVQPPEWPEGESTLQYLVKHWIPAVQEQLEKHHCHRNDNGALLLESAFLIVSKGTVCFVGGDFAVDEFGDYLAIGSGEQAAMAVLHALDGENFSPQVVMDKALKAAAHCIPTVSGPFRSLRLEPTPKKPSRAAIKKAVRSVMAEKETAK